MVSTIASESHPTILGVPQGPLELRVTSAPLAGQIVRLHASKCTIGSGHRCTLRLQARRVEPVHCLILRGEQGTVIRRWATNTRLNGAAFTDAPLLPGDRLTVGPIELEVLRTGQAEEESSESEPRLPAVRFHGAEARQAEHSSLTTVMTENDDALLAELVAREEALNKRQEVLAVEQMDWEQRKAGLQAELEALSHELNNARQIQLDLPILTENHDRLEAELAQKQAALAEAEERLEKARYEFDAQRSAQEESIVARRKELDGQSALLELAQEKLKSEQLALENQKRCAEEAFETREAELMRQQQELRDSLREQSEEGQTEVADFEERESVLEAARQAWAAERSIWETTRQETSQQLREQQQELQEKNEALAAERAEWEAERNSAEQEIAEQRAALAELNRALESKQARLEEEWSRLEREQAELREQATESCDESLASKATRRPHDEAQEEVSEEADFESAQEEEEPPYSSENWQTTSELSPRQLHLEDEPEGVEAGFSGSGEEANLTASDEPVDEETETSHSATSAEEAADPYSGSLAERLFGIRKEDSENATEDPIAETETDSPEGTEANDAPAFTELSQESPAESSGLMDRLRAMAWEADESEPATRDRELLPSRPPVTRPSFEPAVPLPGPGQNTSSGATASTSSSGQEAEEDSIEDYMARLLKRVRGETGQNEGFHAPTVNRQPMTPQREPAGEALSASGSTETSSADEESSPEKPEKPFEMAPRQMPAELTSNLAAMRELANFSAREAIDQSVRNRWAQAAVGKFSVAGLAVLCAVLLFVWTKDPMSVPFLGGGIALLVAVFWGLQGVIILRNVRQANQQIAAQKNAEEEEANDLRQMLYEDEENSADENEPQVVEISGDDPADL